MIKQRHTFGTSEAEDRRERERDGGLLRKLGRNAPDTRPFEGWGIKL
jgi:hypothetical protein